MKFRMNLNTVAQTATKDETGTAYSMLMSKKISIRGMLLPAPERPPAFDSAIKMNMRTRPMISILGLAQIFV